MSDEKNKPLIQEVSPSLHYRLSRRYIEHYGMKLELGIREEKRTTWHQRFELESGERLTIEEVKELKKSGKVGEGAIAKVVWEEGPPEWVGQETSYTWLYDQETFVDKPATVLYFGTTDGPIIATVADITDTSEWVTLIDPAHVQYSPNGQINLLPIFGVARRMEMHRSALRQRAQLSPMLAEVYLQFVMQNRQFKYELRPSKPMATTPPVGNDEKAPFVQTEK